ncbi:hypothetical protein JD844_005806 [Phrynosoma platyrhinos]|uniref:5'-3' exonuclease PLD3 n=1 Tax=Phrynosoma platyrhinos TaxID=52577 RepID=A0ABQ7TPR6_PHRPL|nr:hypothetical protein JD844_005806 [Phrynosoma platyrhinos]
MRRSHSASSLQCLLACGFCSSKQANTELITVCLVTVTDTRFLCLLRPSSLEKMKPHVTYQQLKTLHIPEELPLTEQPRLAPRKFLLQDSRYILVIAILSTMLLAAFLVRMFFLPFDSPASIGNVVATPSLDNTCSDPCRRHQSEYFIHKAESFGRCEFLKIAKGEEILAELLKLPGRGVSVRIAVNPPTPKQPCNDLQKLEEIGVQVRKVNLPRLTSGILHTKFWIVDQMHLFLGSANMDWRALTQSAPPALCAPGRTQDLQALLGVIDEAQEFVYIAVMSYLPTMEFSHPKRFWPMIDNFLRKAAYERQVRVRLLVGCWRHSKSYMFPFLRSLNAMQDNRTHYNVEVRLFVVPANETQAQIPYARVNHSKFMVTDKVAYVGTSNWSGDYFLHTAGSALVVNESNVEARIQPTFREQLQNVFERDWDSQYSWELNSLGQWKDFCSSH